MFALKRQDDTISWTKGFIAIITSRGEIPEKSTIDEYEKLMEENIDEESLFLRQKYVKVRRQHLAAAKRIQL